MWEDDLTGILGIGDNHASTTQRKPGTEELNECEGELCPFVVLGFRAVLFGTIESEEDRHGEAGVGIPGPGYIDG
jgi:hypothetical protein